MATYTDPYQQEYLNKAGQYATTTAQQNYDWQKMINDQSLAKQQQALDTQRATAQNDYTAQQNKLAEEETSIQNEYQAALNKAIEEQNAAKYGYQQSKNQTSASAAQQAKQLSELMSQKGLGRSGSAVSGLVGINTAKQQGLNDIVNQENQANTSFANRMTEMQTSKAAALSALQNRAAEAQQAYQTNINNLEAQRALLVQQGGQYNNALAAQLAQEIEAQKQKAYLDYQTIAQQAASLTGTYQGQQTLAAQQLANQIAQQALANQYQQAELTGTYNGADTIAKQTLNAQINAELNKQAAAILEAYLKNTGNASLPSNVIPWINSMFPTS